jgi:hypothetical protein
MGGSIREVHRLGIGQRYIGKILVPLAVRREARKEMPANVAALKRNLES